MFVKHAAPTSIDEFAAMSTSTTTLYFGVGADDGDDLLRFTNANLCEGEELVTIDDNAGCLSQIELPEQRPTIGAWCSKGVCIGYAFDSQSILELMQESRRFFHG